MHYRYNKFEGMLTHRIWQSPVDVTYWFDIFNIVNKVGAEDLKLKVPIILDNVWNLSTDEECWLSYARL